MTQIYHNPRCSKSRETLALLTARGITPEVVLYLDTPPSREQILDLLAQLQLSDPRALMRTKEARYSELNLSAQNGEALIQAMVENPQLIERPIVLHQGAARIGRPPETVLELFA
ncbi:MAG: arsenate reductase (glutaredoxin) [Aeromonas sp.]